MKLSIITINYNNKEGLYRTIESVIQQTLKEYEWIIIDGGSKDGSYELIRKYQEYFAYWCSEPDKGIYNAMNKGIKQAHGDYLLFMNSGDVFYNNTVLQRVEGVNSNADLILGQVVRMDNNLLIRKYFDNILMQLYLDTLNHQGTFIRASLFNDNLYDENLRIASDWKFWLDAIIRKNASVEILDIIVAKQDMTGISSDKSEGALIQKREREMILNEFFSPIFRKELDNLGEIYESPYTFLSNKLKSNNFLYVIGWKILRILACFVK